MTKLHTLTLTTVGVPEEVVVFGHPRIELDEWTATVGCYEGGCHGWQECWEPHTVDGYDGPNDGPWESEDEAPWFEEEEFVFHGVPHTWRYGWGWTVEYPGCVLAANDSVHDYAHDILVEFGPGVYLIDDDWDDDSVEITAVSMGDGSPLPETGWAWRMVKGEL